jgi:hypothetical protein
MLRITTHDSPEALTFQVEGRLVGAWAKELEQSWKTAAPFRGNRARIIDLTGILFIDEEGKRILAKLFREGACFRTAGPMTESIVSDITGKPNSVLPILLMAAAMFAQSQPLHLTLRDAEEMALKQNPQVRIANLNTAVTQTTQACDRFQAGVANNIEVITAQDELARTNDNQIVALYRYNQARTDLAHATGQMESLYAK